MAPPGLQEAGPPSPSKPDPNSPAGALSRTHVLLLFIEHLISATSGVPVLALNTHLLVGSQWARQRAGIVPLCFVFMNQD